MTIRTLAAGALLALPMAAQAAPVPIFTETNSFAIAYDENAIDIDELYPSGGDTIFFQSPNPERVDRVDLTVYLSAEDLTVALEGDTLLRRTAPIPSPDPDDPRTPDSILLEIGDLSGESASLFGSSAFVLFDFFAEDFYNIELDGQSFFDGQNPLVDVAIYATAPSPIPVPATLPLLAGALGIGALVLRRRAA